jgi:hypothetical protein
MFSCSLFSVGSAPCYPLNPSGIPLLSLTVYGAMLPYFRFAQNRSHALTALKAKASFSLRLSTGLRRAKLRLSAFCIFFSPLDPCDLLLGLLTVFQEHKL